MIVVGRFLENQNFTVATLHKRNGGHVAVFKPRFGGFLDVLNVANLAHT